MIEDAHESCFVQLDAEKLLATRVALVRRAHSEISLLSVASKGMTRSRGSSELQSALTWVALLLRTSADAFPPKAGIATNAATSWHHFTRPHEPSTDRRSVTRSDCVVATASLGLCPLYM